MKKLACALGIVVGVSWLGWAQEDLWERAREAFGGAPPVEVLEPARVELGRRLFYDPRLSLDRSVSCFSCHDLANFGDDGRRFSPGVGGQRGKRNAPSVYHAHWQFSQFWDGRSQTVETQAMEPILNPIEMAIPDPQVVVQRLQAIPEYRELFAQAFPRESKITLVLVGQALGSFERGLVTVSPLDHYLDGDRTALDDEQKRGMETFLRQGCAGCHRGPGLGGLDFRIPPGLEGSDRGRGDFTHDPRDNGFFKVSSLRNVSETAPYFHDGSTFSLSEAVTRHGPRSISPTEVAQIVEFLGAVRGDIPREYIAAPVPFGDPGSEKGESGSPATPPAPR